MLHWRRPGCVPGPRFGTVELPIVSRKKMSPLRNY
jgi:hypothetical protein